MPFAGLATGFLESTVNSLLFGDALGVTATQVTVLALVAVAVLGALAVIVRPLLFASADPDVAAAGGVPVRALSALFLLLLGATAAEAGQITGALLVFALMVMPAATAQLLTARPDPSLVWTMAIAVRVTWAARAAAYLSPWPTGFYVTSFAFAAYALAHFRRLAWS